MTFMTARVVNGRIELPRDEYPDGTEVTILAPEPIHRLSPEEESELEDRFARVQSGEYVDWDDLRARLSVK
ncbi:MAG: hypothetical protein AAGC60_08780 [Acidobacteriota bacterium]